MDPRQVALPLQEIPIRECRDPKHIGQPWLPLDRFVKNGNNRRHVCRQCWARSQKERISVVAPRPDPEAEQSLLARMLNRIWRPTKVS